MAKPKKEIIDTIGDVFLVEFDIALYATRCAYDIQMAGKEYNISLAEGSMKGKTRGITQNVWVFRGCFASGS